MSVDNLTSNSVLLGESPIFKEALNFDKVSASGRLSLVAF